MAPATGGLRRLKQRSQFVKAARGNRAGRPAFGMQSVKVEDEAPGVGFTVTKKIGNSPERNRIRRRLRAAVTMCASDFVPGYNYVLVGRREALHEPFSRLVSDISQAIARVHTAKPNSARPGATRAKGERNNRS
ncbi:ribonuclease P protein component [Devosia algicola]|uniref:Ribonuclease P protein component n=1 Tax=Devosia algicola TaxID=3026418 RepID=A0ABY7YLP7_9HYPH|nr:ribonuclease P protein component [Devosia algicola]WDR02219.1 ribonuclease P protein component [Devosia algicola]